MCQCPSVLYLWNWCRLQKCFHICLRLPLGHKDFSPPHANVDLLDHMTEISIERRHVYHRVAHLKYNVYITFAHTNLAKRQTHTLQLVLHLAVSRLIFSALSLDLHDSHTEIINSCVYTGPLLLVKQIFFKKKKSANISCIRNCPFTKIE